MKIAVITPRYAISGVPLAQIRFAKSLKKSGYDVTLIVGYVSSEYDFQKPKNIETQIFNSPRVKGMLIPLVKYLRKQQPDVIFSAEDHLTLVVIIAALISRSQVKISGSSRVTPFDTYRGSMFQKGWILKILMKLLSWRADVLTCVSKDMVQQYRQVFRTPRHQHAYNIIDEKISRPQMLEECDHCWTKDKTIPLIVAAGQLAPWKGFDCAIDAMAILNRQRRVRLLILGEGPERAALQEKIIRNGLTESVCLYGNVSNPLKFFVNSNVFLLSSRVEGMPNVLVEAMMCGCTPVSTDCPTGPRELLQGGLYGYLVPVDDAEAMAKALATAIEKPIPDDLLKVAIQPFSEKNVLSRHFELLGILSNESRN